MSAALPPLASRWAEAVLGHAPRSEARSDCGRCDRCAPDGPGVFFNPVTRCCTYTPELANFLVGGKLREGGEGADGLRRRIARGPRSPLGLGRDAAWERAYAEAKAAGQFGRELSLRCPHHLDDGGCGVWAWRDAVCATWFCRHEDGAVGQARWRALREWLIAVQDTVAELVAETVATRRVFEGQEEAFYLECVEEAEGLEWEDLRHRGGSLLRTRIDALQAAWAATPEPLPERATWSNITTGALSDGRVRVFGYSRYDPVDIDAALFDGDREPNGPELRRLLQFRVFEAL